MDIFRPPVTSEQKDSAWERIENYVKEERPLQPIRKIVVKGSVDVVFRRSDKPMLIVAGETADAVASVKTHFNGGKLVIEREGMTISFGNSRMTFHGSVGSFVMGDIVNGKPMGTSISQGKVGIALPEAPVIKIKGCGDVTLLDLRQAGLDLEIEGSGDITAYGQVAHLDVEIAGSGDVDASELIADRASLSVAGSGDIEAFIRSEVRARVAGSGDILVRGNPPHRDHSVAGSGKIKFR
ncbi:DUF2807 domain-containing protein [Burkholderia multivorans]|uniref:DUF2807 domain-containing protein n=1 Tax=Burkholderia multivorans TaxID=87883 RepID=UPI0021C1080A|nr:DUF2807 domain-containing protein [Burkholderia multivorans]